MWSTKPNPHLNRRFEAKSSDGARQVRTEYTTALEVGVNAEVDFAGHRDRLLNQLATDEALLLFGGPHHLRNGDAEFKYRPASDVYWLTGWTHPQVAVFLRP